MKAKSKKKSLVVDLEGKLARALADYDNLRKRIEREKESFLRFANKGLITKFLAIYDMLDSAQKHAGDSGIAIILDEFKKVLRDEGVEEIRVIKGDVFDEELHEAVEAVEGSKANLGKIAGVLLSGWKFSEGQVIRPVKVKVFRRIEK